MAVIENSPETEVALAHGGVVSCKYITHKMLYMSFNNVRGFVSYYYSGINGLVVEGRASDERVFGLIPCAKLL